MTDNDVPNLIRVLKSKIRANTEINKYRDEWFTKEKTVEPYIYKQLNKRDQR